MLYSAPLWCAMRSCLLRGIVCLVIHHDHACRSSNNFFRTNLLEVLLSSNSGIFCSVLSGFVRRGAAKMYVYV